jgi:DNA polymerase-2
MALEGIYAWIVFLSSRSDERLPVANRYFGRFADGSLKIRGIQARRRDTAVWIRSAQESFLDIMKRAPELKTLYAIQPEMDALYRRLEGELLSGRVSWRELLIRRTVSRPVEDYTTASAGALSLEQLAEEGIRLQPGEKVRYLILSKGNRDRHRRYLTEERALKEEESGRIPRYDAKAYTDLLREAFREVWELFAPEGYFRILQDGQLRLDIAFMP